MGHCKRTVFNLFAVVVIGEVAVVGSVVDLGICGQADGSNVVAVDGMKDLFLEEFLNALKHPEMVFAGDSGCHVFSFASGGGKSTLLVRLPGYGGIAVAKEVAREAAAGVEKIVTRGIPTGREGEWRVPR